MKFNELVTLYFERTNAYWTLWGFYITFVVGALAGFVAAPERASKKLLARIIIVGFVGFACANLGALDEVLQARNRIAQIISGVFPPPSEAAPWVVENLKGTIGTRSRFQLWAFHLASDLAFVSAILAIGKGKASLVSQEPPTGSGVGHKGTTEIDDIYREMEKQREVGELERRIDRAFQVFVQMYGWWLIFEVLCFAGLYYWVGRWSNVPEPLLKGAPQFTLLAIVIALSAYLRQVRSAAVELRDKIAGGEMWNLPMIEPYARFTKRKLELLDDTSIYLTIASPFLITLFVVLGLRACTEAFTRIRPSATVDRILAVGDLVILIWVMVAFIALAVTHFKSRIKDDRIRAAARAFEAEILQRNEAEDKPSKGRSNQTIQHRPPEMPMIIPS